jgi:predicted outer membrane lipoprotein
VSCEERAVTCSLSRARRCVACAFVILTAKWRLLNEAIETNVNKAERTVRCICLLHDVGSGLEGTTHIPSVHQET